MLNFRRQVLPLLALAVVTATLVLSCTAEPTPGTEQNRTDRSAMTLAQEIEPANFHPLLGYGEFGAAKIFDGLLAYRADRSLRPSLAAELPRPAPDGLSWTIKLRSGVTFHDGSPYTAEDVVATYRALLNPAYHATIRSDFAMLTNVTALAPDLVRFDLAYPYSPLPHKLTLGIMPSEALATPSPADKAEFASKPIGTGPYQLAEWRKGEALTLTAYDRYFDGAPKVRKVTVRFIRDDNNRIERLKSGEFDGAPIPAGLLKSFSDSGYQVNTHASADYRVVSLPAENPVTGDKGVRLALNHAIDREKLINSVLAGKGVSAATPISPALPEFYEPSAQFRFDRAEAERILDQTGWLNTESGIRARQGVLASFTLLHPKGDIQRAELAKAFSADARAIGIEVKLAEAEWSALHNRNTAQAMVLGGGNSFDPDLAAYALLHSSYANQPQGNPSAYRNAAVDRTLDAGRRESEPAQRVAQYREFQRTYAADPGMVFLAFVEHSYVRRTGWSGYQPIIDPHDRGLTWGAWWNLAEWTPQS